MMKNMILDNAASFNVMLYGINISDCIYTISMWVSVQLSQRKQVLHQFFSDVLYFIIFLQ
jgi:hypothetical protein